MSKGVQIAGGASVIALLLGWYAWAQLEDGATFTYYQSLAEFQVAAVAGDHARVHGYVANGTIERDVAAKRVSFVVQETPPHAGGDGGGTLDVVFASLETPDLFKDGAEVVVEGKLVASGSHHHFEADKLMAKCPSKFEGSESDPKMAAAINQ
jgi:cytochrome c-type biogenesis protein CcmE